ncbi:MAG TPA: hypothetical protein VK752_17975 [Bryobacteraceae bacterium]|nr:hypothetical protein [Bryobacteraceae bacterium]
MLGFAGTRSSQAQAVRVEEFQDLASVVLPASLGRSRTDKIAVDFVSWFRTYKAGAEISSGYGFPRTQVTGPNPSIHYDEQLRKLDLSQLDAAARRTAVEKALDASQIDRIPPRPNGKHVAADLLAYFYGSAHGEDFLYGVAIKRDDCRGLGDSGQRPAGLS